MSDLVTWLRAQLNIDESDGRAYLETTSPDELGREWVEQALAEIDAKRRMIQEATCAVRHDDKYLRLLALPYADRPGYCEEWRP